MALFLKRCRLLGFKAIDIPRSSQLSTSSFLQLDKSWRERKGLPPNPNKDKTLLDLPDYSFLDGRPTPYGSRQKLRIEKQRQYTEKIIQLTREVDLALRLYNEKQEKKVAEANKRISMKLQLKGDRRVDS